MDYDRYINLDTVTVQDCIDLYEKRDKITIINDGRISNFEDEKDA